jgi:hypothetical protein
VASWKCRWPSAQQPSAGATMVVINARDILLQALSKEAAKHSPVSHQVCSLCYVFLDCAPDLCSPFCFLGTIGQAHSSNSGPVTRCRQLIISHDDPP